MVIWSDHIEQIEVLPCEIKFYLGECATLGSVQWDGASTSPVTNRTPEAHSKQAEPGYTRSIAASCMADSTLAASDEGRRSAG